jgi:hypothetical protein
MINIIKIKTIDIVLILIFIFYLLAILLNFRNGYISGDEIFFLSGHHNEDSKDWRYFIWTSYIHATSSIYINAPLIINLTTIIIFMRELNAKQIFSYFPLVVFLMIPSVFYFLLTFLRDPVFMIFSFVILSLIGRHETLSLRRQFFIWLGILIIGHMRLYFLFVYICAFLLSHKYFSKYLMLILGLIFTIFIAAGITMAFNSDFFDMYFNFFKFGHLREHQQIGIMDIPLSVFTDDRAAINILLSPLYFWFIPSNGFGHIFDKLFFIENFLILILFLFSILRHSGEQFKIDRALRMSWTALTLSIFMAASVASSQDIYRFRLMFLPFLFYVALANKRVNSFKY